MLEIKEAVAVITGAGGGIGEALAQYWVGQGGKVVLGDVSAEGLSRVESTIKARGGEIPIGRLVEPEEVASLIGELYRNEDIAGDTFSFTAACGWGRRLKGMAGLPP